MYGQQQTEETLRSDKSVDQDEWVQRPGLGGAFQGKSTKVHCSAVLNTGQFPTSSSTVVALLCAPPLDGLGLD